MAVKTFCTICEKFIKDVTDYELKKLTGKEICTECADRVNGIIKNLGVKNQEHIQKLNVAHQTMMEKYKKLQSAHNSNVERINGMYRVARAELDSVLKEILDR